MAWPVWNWGEGWGISGMCRTDRCAELPNPNGVVSSVHLEGIAAVDGISGYPSIGFGTVGAALGQLLRSRLRQKLISGSMRCPV